MTGGMPVHPGDPVRIGGYRVLSRLGDGGQGVVYLAEDRAGERYAIKVLRAEWLTDSSARRRLSQEIAAAAQVSPFCTARLVEAVVEGSEPYLVTEYVRGPTLAQYVAEHGTLTGTDLHRLAIGTATALVAIHQAGVVHRDLKPSNVILSPQGPRVIDFGISREQAAPVTMTDRVIGTPMYMAPEQVQAEAVGPPADLFSWASTVTFAATAQAPFAGPSLAVIVHRLTTMEPDLSGVDPPLSEILEQCLAKDPEDRPTSQQALLMLLGQPLPKKDASDPTGLLTEALAVATTTAEAVLADRPTSGKKDESAADPPEPIVRAGPDHSPTVMPESAGTPPNAFPGRSSPPPPVAPPRWQPPVADVPPAAPSRPAAAQPPRISSGGSRPSQPQPGAVRPRTSAGAGPARPQAGRPVSSSRPTFVPQRGGGYSAHRQGYRQTAGPVLPAPSRSGKPSDIRSSIIVVAVVILTVALLVVLGLVVLALAKSSRAAPQGLGGQSDRVLLLTRRAPAPRTCPSDQLPKECSGPGNLLSLTSS